MRGASPIPLADQLEEIDRVIRHLEGELTGHEIARETRVAILRAIRARLEQTKES